MAKKRMMIVIETRRRLEEVERRIKTVKTKSFISPEPVYPVLGIWTSRGHKTNLVQWWKVTDDIY